MKFASCLSVNCHDSQFHRLPTMKFASSLSVNCHDSQFYRLPTMKFASSLSVNCHDSQFYRLPSMKFANFMVGRRWNRLFTDKLDAKYWGVRVKSPINHCRFSPLSAYMTRYTRHGKCIPVCVNDEKYPSWFLGNAGSTFVKLLHMFFSDRSGGVVRLEKYSSNSILTVNYCLLNFNKNAMYLIKSFWHKLLIQTPLVLYINKIIIRSILM